MSDTMRFEMPLLDAAQAQKHGDRERSAGSRRHPWRRQGEARDLTVPPASPAEGEGLDPLRQARPGLGAATKGNLPCFVNGGWAFVQPWAGADVWVAAEGARATWTGADWISGHAGGTPGVRRRWCA